MISVIIPLYNVENFMDECLKSIVNQTVKELEIILVDDGSPDTSGKKADQWSQKDKRIKVIHKQNGGLSSARNAGLDICKGDYITFVDSDDIVSEDMCEVLLKSLKETDSDIAICEAEHIFDQKPQFTNTSSLKTLNSEEAIYQLWYQTSFLPSAWGKLYKNDVFNHIRFTEGIIFEDIDIMHELFDKANRIVYTDAKLYGYVHHENSITTKPFARRDLIILDICKKIMDFASDKSEEIKKAAKAYNITGAMRVYLNAPDEFKNEINESKEILSKYSKEVIKDKNIRKKSKYALILYRWARPLLKIIYKKINRWG